MIHYLSGGIIADYENLIYVFVAFESGEKAWYISPFPQINEGDCVLAPLGRTSAKGRVTRVENVTKQTAPYPVNRTREIEGIL